MNGKLEFMSLDNSTWPINFGEGKYCTIVIKTFILQSAEENTKKENELYMEFGYIYIYRAAV